MSRKKKTHLHLTEQTSLTFTVSSHDRESDVREENLSAIYCIICGFFFFFKNKRTKSDWKKKKKGNLLSVSTRCLKDEAANAHQQGAYPAVTVSPAELRCNHQSLEVQIQQRAGVRGRVIRYLTQTCASTRGRNRGRLSMRG